MQRMIVDFPEPDGPIIQMTSPFITSNGNPFDDFEFPERFVQVLDGYHRLIFIPAHDNFPLGFNCKFLFQINGPSRDGIAVDKKQK